MSIGLGSIVLLCLFCFVFRVGSNDNRASMKGNSWFRKRRGANEETLPRDLGEDEMIIMRVMMMVLMIIVMVSSLIYRILTLGNFIRNIQSSPTCR